MGEPKQLPHTPIREAQRKGASPWLLDLVLPVEEQLADRERLARAEVVDVEAGDHEAPQRRVDDAEAGPRERVVRGGQIVGDGGEGPERADVDLAPGHRDRVVGAGALTALGARVDGTA